MIKIKLEIKNIEIELTMDEANELWNELGEIFKQNSSLSYSEGERDIKNSSKTKDYTKNNWNIRWK